MKKYLFLLALISCTWVSAQESITLNCKTPGELSTLLSSAEWRKIKNLTITGNVDDTDMEFLANRSNKYIGTLKHLDLTDVVFCTYKDGLMYQTYECVLYRDFILSYLALPTQMTSYRIMKLYSDPCLQVDTLLIGSETFSELQTKELSSLFGDYNFLYIREGVKSITNPSSARSCTTKANKIHIPKTLKIIPEYSFASLREDNVLDINIHDDIEQMGNKAIDAYLETDTFRVPQKMTRVRLGAFRAKNNQVYYVHKNVDYINNYNYDGSQIALNPDSTQIFHMEGMIPPTLNSPEKVDGKEAFAKKIVYVPKGSVEAYKKAPIWCQATILEEPVFVDSVRITPTTLQLRKGNTYSLAATVYPSNADNMEVIWNSTNSNIANVDQNGVVTALETGTVAIKVIAKENTLIQDSCIVTVYQPVTKLQLNEQEIKLKVGEEKALRAEIIPSDADNKGITWQSGNEEVATVSSGIVKAMGSGTTFVYAISQYNETIKDSCYVTVTQPVTGLALNTNAVTLNQIGQTYQLEAVVEPETAENKTVNWKCTNEAVCLVSSNGALVATGYGMAVVIATTEDGGHMAVCTVTVDKDASIEGLLPDDKTFDIYNLQGQLIKAAATRDDFTTLPAGIYIVNGEKVVKR